MTFKFTAARSANRTYVEMLGHLDERASMPALRDLEPGALTLDLAGISLINSLGCRRWLTWISEVETRVDFVELARCSFAVIQQINVLGGFAPKKTRVSSFFVPYACARCGHGARVLHKVEASFDSNLVPDTLPCAACGDQMLLEVMRQTYFKFLGTKAA